MSVLTIPVTSASPAWLLRAARCLIFFGIASIMLSVPLLNKSYTIAVILFFVSLQWLSAWPTLFKQKFVIASLVLIALFTLGIFYTEGSYHLALRAWNKYLKLAYPLFFIPLFVDKKARGFAIFAFIASVMTSEIFTYLHYFKIVLLGLGPGKHWLFVQDLDGGYIVSFAAFLLAHIAIKYKQFRWSALICCLICSFDILFLNQERAGYLVYLGLVGLFLWQRWQWRGFFAALITLPLMLGTLYLTSPKFNNRLHQIGSDVSHYQEGQERTSIGLRLAFAKYSYKVIKDHWLIGAGTGSFAELYQAMHGPKLDDNTWPSHPHNEYILELFQIGIFGLLAFLYYLYSVGRVSFDLPTSEQWWLQGLLVGFALLSCCNASLLVNPAGAVFITFLSVFVASHYDQTLTPRNELCE